MGVIAEGGLGISFGHLVSVGCVSVWILWVVLSRGGEDGFGVDDELLERDGALLDEGLVRSVKDVLELAVVGFFEEAIELRRIGESSHGEAAHLGEDGVGIEELNEPGDGLDLFEVFDEEGSEGGMSGIPGASDVGIEVFEAGQVEGGEEGMVFPIEIRAGDERLIVVEQRALKISPSISSLAVVSVGFVNTYTIPHPEEIARKIMS